MQGKNEKEKDNHKQLVKKYFIKRQIIENKAQYIYVKKYDLDKDADVTNRYSASIANPTVQPDGKTEKGVPVPDLQNVEHSKEYGEINEL